MLQHVLGAFQTKVAGLNMRLHDYLCTMIRVRHLARSTITHVAAQPTSNKLIVLGTLSNAAVGCMIIGGKLPSA